MATLCSEPTRWEDREPVGWCPEVAVRGGDRCAAHVPYEATDPVLERQLQAEEAAA